jgi:hypothetical protein
MNFRSQNGVISAVTAILSEIPVQMLSRVFDQWIERLHGCITNGREYVQVNISELIIYLC